MTWFEFYWFFNEVHIFWIRSMKYADSKHLEFSEHQHELHYPDPSQTGFSMPTNHTAGYFNVFSLSVTSSVQSLPSTPDALSAQIPKPPQLTKPVLLLILVQYHPLKSTCFHYAMIPVILRRNPRTLRNLVSFIPLSSSSLQT